MVIHQELQAKLSSDHTNGPVRRPLALGMDDQVQQKDAEIARLMQEVQESWTENNVSFITLLDIQDIFLYFYVGNKLLLSTFYL